MIADSNRKGRLQHKLPVSYRFEAKCFRGDAFTDIERRAVHREDAEGYGVVWIQIICYVGVRTEDSGCISIGVSRGGGSTMATPPEERNTHVEVEVTMLSVRHSAVTSSTRAAEMRFMFVR